MKIKVISKQEQNKTKYSQALVEDLMKNGFTKEEALAYAKWQAGEHPVTMAKKNEEVKK